MSFKKFLIEQGIMNRFEKRWLNESSMDMLQTKEWLDKMNIKNYTINEDGTVDVDDVVWLHNKGLNEIPVQFGVVSGRFNCSYNNLTSLKGCPKKVYGDFICSSNNLTSLKGAPSEVGGWFDCSYTKITSLKGAPSEVGGWFDCSYTKITSLEGGPKKVGMNYMCETTLLKSVDGLASYIGGDLFIDVNKLPSSEIKRIYEICHIANKVSNGNNRGLQGRKNLLIKRINRIQKELNNLMGE